MQRTSPTQCVGVGKCTEITSNDDPYVLDNGWSSVDICPSHSPTVVASVPATAPTPPEPTACMLGQECTGTATMYGMVPNGSPCSGESGAPLNVGNCAADDASMLYSLLTRNASTVMWCQYQTQEECITARGGGSCGTSACVAVTAVSGIGWCGEYLTPEVDVLIDFGSGMCDTTMGGRSGGSGEHTSAIAGGVIGGLIVIAAAGFVALKMRQAANRTQHPTFSNPLVAPGVTFENVMADAPTDVLTSRAASVVYEGEHDAEDVAVA